MKTLVSLITGRKDEPIFDTNDNDLILDYIKYYYCVDAEFNEEGHIVLSNDEFKIIDVEVVKL